jgi:hypothetical protein
VPTDEAMITRQMLYSPLPACTKVVLAMSVLRDPQNRF